MTTMHGGFHHQAASDRSCGSWVVQTTKRVQPKTAILLSRKPQNRILKAQCDSVEPNVVTFDPLVVERNVVNPLRSTEQPMDCTFTVSKMVQEDVSAASVVITRAFASSPQYVPIDECKVYCLNMLQSEESEGIMLVGRCEPLSASTEVPSWLPKGQSSRIVATASLSFCSKSRENFLSLKPPDEEAYLANIAVDPIFRRLGLAKHMLQCAEEYCKAQGKNSIYLHVRLGDEAARSLYDTNGYQEIAADSWLVKLQNRTPNALMCKHL